MKILTKYPLKIGNILVPAQTEVKIADIKEVRKVFPKMEYNEKSESIAIQILDLPFHIVLKKQLQFTEV